MTVVSTVPTSSEVCDQEFGTAGGQGLGSRATAGAGGVMSNTEMNIHINYDMATFYDG